MKKILLVIALLTSLFFTGCKKDTAEKPEATTITIGSQIWTKANYTNSGKELFTYNEAKAVKPPDGFRLPTRYDWGTLFTFTGDKIGFTMGTVYNSGTNIITETRMEGNFEIIKSLLASVKWDTFTGTNTTGFNAKPIDATFWVNFYVSDPVFGYTELSSAGYYVGVFSKDVRAYFPINTYPDKYAIRFVKDK